MNKKLSVHIFLIFSCWIFFSCKKDNFNYPPSMVVISKIIYFPKVSIVGERLVILQQGAPYTDSVISTLNGQPVSYTTNLTVSTANPGVYNVVYTATNPQGFSATDWRTVVVIGNDVAANDFSGTYLRAATGVTSTWTKTASGVYTVENPGGAGVGAGLQVIAVNYTGTQISIPQQESSDFGGLVSSGDETYTLTPPPPQYSWIFHATNYGTSLRTFIKQ